MWGALGHLDAAPVVVAAEAILWLLLLHADPIWQCTVAIVQMGGFLLGEVLVSALVLASVLGSWYVTKQLNYCE